jgi:hypothetical protein
LFGRLLVPGICLWYTGFIERTEEYFSSQDIYKTILTTDTAESFYIRRGYQKEPDISAKNNDTVFIKSLR